jgi:hypothetical protein
MENKKEHLCNLCGLSLTIGEDGWYKSNAGLIDTEVYGGFLSTPGNGYGALGDMLCYKFSLCEFCLDWLFTRFKVQVKVTDHGEELPFRPAEQCVREDDWRRLKDEFFQEYERHNKARE